MTRMLIVDGTGPSDDGQYAVDMAGSFCKQIAATTTCQASYWRGPSLLGFETSSIAEEVIAAMRAALEDVVLVGYSRGGAAVIQAAKCGIPVKAMFLFDAVDRSAISDLEVVSANVAKVYHARRNEAYGRQFEGAVNVEKMQFSIRLLHFAVTGLNNYANPVDRFESLVAVSEEFSDFVSIKYRHVSLQHMTRNELLGFPVGFGNCGTSHAGSSGSDYEQQFFDGSHGALGGVPWPEEEVPGDRDCVPVIRKQVWAWLRRESLIG